MIRPSPHLSLGVWIFPLQLSSPGAASTRLLLGALLKRVRAGTGLTREVHNDTDVRNRCSQRVRQPAATVAKSHPARSKAAGAVQLPVAAPSGSHSLWRWGELAGSHLRVRGLSQGGNAKHRHRLGVESTQFRECGLLSVPRRPAPIGRRRGSGQDGDAGGLRDLPSDPDRAVQCRQARFGVGQHEGHAHYPLVAHGAHRRHEGMWGLPSDRGQERGRDPAVEGGGSSVRSGFL